MLKKLEKKCYLSCGSSKVKNWVPSYSILREESETQSVSYVSCVFFAPAICLQGVKNWQIASFGADFGQKVSQWNQRFIAIILHIKVLIKCI